MSASTEDLKGSETCGGVLTRTFRDVVPGKRKMGDGLEEARVCVYVCDESDNNKRLGRSAKITSRSVSAKAEALGDVGGKSLSCSCELSQPLI